MVGFWLFLKDAFSTLGPLAVPLFISLSIVFVITAERILFFSFIFKQSNVIASIQDIIDNNKSYPKQLREDLIEIELEDVSRSLEFGISLLKFIAGVATMLGLLGTVLGMIEVFSSISSIKTAVSPAVISAGIKKAMYTTAYGLAIALFASFSQYIFEKLAKKIFLKIEEYAILLNTTTEYQRLARISKSN